MSEALYRALVPNAPLHRRTDVDPQRLFDMSSARGRFATFSKIVRRIERGLQKPSLVSSYSGRIENILLCFPKYAVAAPALVPGYQSLLRALRGGTRFIVAHSKTSRPTIDDWFRDAGHSEANVTYVPLEDYVSLTDWAEDAYVSLVDKQSDVHYLMEPWEFRRAGDALIADAVEGSSNIVASQAPLIFQGGNCLVGSDFWFLGRDYFADSVDMFGQSRGPVPLPEGTQPADMVYKLFRDYVDADRRLLLIGTDKQLAIPGYVGAKEGAEFILDIPSGGAGSFQPIFHIDMFVTLVGDGPKGKFQILLGDPSLADEILDKNSPYALADVYNGIAKQLSDAGFEVLRNPLVHWPTKGQVLSLKDVEAYAVSHKSDALMRAARQLRELGAVDDADITIRDWHHITWNNCLVENDGDSKEVYLPTFGYGPQASLAVLDMHMKSQWEELGFKVHMLGNFNGFAERQGVVHCIKKYLERGVLAVA
jgi:hypothetical protein